MLMAANTSVTNLYGYPNGAWAYGFLKKQDPWMGGNPANRLGMAILAIKHEFTYNGYTGFADNAWYGSSMWKVVEQFQKDKGLFNIPGITLTPGTVGPTVALKLFEKRAAVMEEKYQIPNKYLRRLVSLESSGDPCALGWVDPRDRGPVQISSYYFPDVTDAQAFDPKYAFDFGARGIKVAANSFGGDFEAGTVAHNVGLLGAELWVDAGKPKTGGTDEYPTLFDRASFYSSLLNKQPV